MLIKQRALKKKGIRNLFPTVCIFQPLGNHNKTLSPRLQINRPQVYQHPPLIIQSLGNQKMSQVLNNNTNCFNIKNSFNNYSAPDDESKILAWLSPLEPWVRHRDIGAKRVGGIGDWLLETKEFRRWHNIPKEDESSHAVLFCDGNPGVGKSCIV